MPQPRKPARLWLQPERRRPDRSVSHAAVWVIRDGGVKVSTGCGADDHAGAEAALNRYIAEKYAAAPLPRNRAAHDVLIADVLANYLRQKGESIARPEELGQRADTLLSWWGEKTVEDLTSENCQAYVTHRGKPQAARRELEDLRAALKLAAKDRLYVGSAEVTLPEKAQPRSEWLTRDEVALMLTTAWRYRQTQSIRKGDPDAPKAPAKKGSHHPWRHLTRFILCAVYTGSRSARIWQASFEREEERPWIDLDAGVYYRRAPTEAERRNKRAPSIRIPDRLLAHMRRWRAQGSRYVVEYRGKPADPKKSYRNLVRHVFGTERRIVRHTTRHTSATWLMQAGVDLNEAAGFLGMSVEVLEGTYGHHHPDHQAGVSAAFSSGRAGRKRA